MWVVGGEWYRKISIRVNIDGGGRGGGLLIEGGGVLEVAEGVAINRVEIRRLLIVLGCLLTVAQPVGIDSLEKHIRCTIQILGIGDLVYNIIRVYDI